jgi:signal transduction histidine kinase
MNQHNQVLAHTFEEGFPVDLKEANIVRPDQAYKVQSLITERGYVLDIAVPLLKGEAGIAHVGISEEAIHQSVADISAMIVWMVIAVVISGIIIMVVLDIGITKPIIELTEVAEKIGSGDLEQKAQVKSGDEIGRLGTVFNKMSENLKTYRDELLLANATLEERVKEEVEASREKDYMLIQRSRLAAMGEMIGHIAHQWRQPLNLLGLILGKIEIDFQDNKLKKANLRDYTANGEDLIEKMSTTIDDFRNFFNPNKEKKEFSPVEETKEAFRLVEGSFKLENITVTIEGKRDVIILGYPNEYSQVILNLINNARDAIKSKEIEDGSIMINIGKDNSNCVVTVTDNGGGIPEEIIEKIFDPYFSSKKEGDGTGLGLYMSKMIIEDNMDGRIEVRNVKDGVKFRVLLPLAYEPPPS